MPAFGPVAPPSRTNKMLADGLPGDTRTHVVLIVDCTLTSCACDRSAAVARRAGRVEDLLLDPRKVRVKDGLLAGRQVRRRIGHGVDSSVSRIADDAAIYVGGDSAIYVWIAAVLWLRCGLRIFAAHRECDEQSGDEAHDAAFISNCRTTSRARDLARLSSGAIAHVAGLARPARRVTRATGFRAAYVISMRATRAPYDIARVSRTLVA